MKISQIIEELNHLPSFLYIYWTKRWKGSYGNTWGQPCPKKSDFIDIDTAKYYNLNMKKIYRKATLEEIDKYTLVKDMKKIKNLCNYRHTKLYTLSEQENYLNNLSNEPLEEIYEQIKMYKLARSLYKDYH